MENSFKRFLSLLLAFVMVLGMIPTGHIHAHAASTNLALNAAVKANDNERGTDSNGNLLVPASAVDGNYVTRWATNASDIADDRCIIIDLGSEKAIKRIEIYFERTDAEQNIQAYEVKVSSDDTVWSDPDQTSPSWETVYVYDKDGYAAQHETITLSQTKTVRYVMLNVTEYVAGSVQYPNVGVNEIEIYGPDYVMNVDDTATITVDGYYPNVTDPNGVVNVNATFSPVMTGHTVADTTTDATLETGKYVLQNTRVNKFLESTSAGGKLWLMGRIVTGAEIWTITKVDGGYTMQASNGQYLTFDGSSSSLTDTETVLSFTWKPTSTNNTNTWQIGCGDQYLNSYDTEQKVAGWWQDGDGGSQWKLYKVTDQPAYTWTLGDAVSQIKDGGYYIFENNEARNRSANLVSSKWSDTNNGGGGTGYGLLMEHNKTNFGEQDIWKITGTAGNYHVQHLHGWNLFIQSGKAVLTSESHTTTIAQGSTTYPEKWQISIGDIQLNWWGGANGTGVQVAGWSNVNGPNNQWNIYEVIPTPVGTTTITFTAQKAGSTEITVGDTVYTFEVNAAPEVHEHNYVGTVTTPATCTEVGEKTFTCSCGEGTYTEEIPVDPTNHVGTTTTKPAVQPTLNAAGKTEEVVCDDCGATISGGETIPQLTAKNAKVLSNNQVLALANCEYTLNSAENNRYSMVHAGTYYVMPAANGATIPQTTASFAGLDLVEGADGTVRINGFNGETYNGGIHFHTEADKPYWNKCNEYNDHTAKHDLYLFKADADSTNADIPGYTMVSFADITAGESYLIAAKNHQGKWFVMVPSNTSEKFDHIALVEAGGDVHPHSYTETITPATCQAAGLKTLTCDCGHKHTEVIAIDPDAHNYESVVTAPTCTEGGYTTYTCSVCGDSYTADETAALGHNKVAHEAKAPTCNEAGWEAYETCSRCDYTTKVEIPATGEHTYTNEYDATCNVCGTSRVVKEFTSEKITGITGIASSNDAADGSNIEEAFDGIKDRDDNYWASVNNSEGIANNEYLTADLGSIYLVNQVVYYRRTQPSGSHYTGHLKDYTIWVSTNNIDWTVAATGQMNDAAYTTITFPAVEAKYVKLTATESDHWDSNKYNQVMTCAEFEVFKAVCEEHVPGAAADCENAQTCTVCGTVLNAALGHDYDAVVTEPTCTEGGYTTYTCSVCGDSYTADETEALGHSFGEWTETTEPTCTEKGVETRTCACGETETRDVDALGHDLTDHEAKAPTCTEVGWDAYEECSRCDYSTYVEKAATGHSYDAVVTAPTCTEGGYTTYTCSVCGDSYTADETEALGHTPAEAVEENRVEATLNSTGSYDAVVYCSVCNAELSRETVTVPALTGAAAEIDGYKYATFEEALEAAEEGDTITLLKEVVITEDTTYDLTGITVESTGDIFIVKSGTLTLEGGEFKAGTDNDGTANAIWADGGNVVINGGTYSVGGDTSAAEQNHQNDLIYTKNGGTVTINGGTFLYTEGVWTLNENDSNRGTITVKGGTFEKFNPADNKSEGEHTSFVAEGYCSKLIGENYVVAAHEYNAVVTDPTCEEKGYTTHTCARCGNEYVDTYVDALGHTEGEAVKENEVAPTLNSTGSYDSVVYCSVCGKELSREKVTVPALTGAAAEIDGYKYATFEEALEAAEEGDTITLLKEVVITEDTTYDLTGITVESTGDIFIVKSGTLTLEGGEFKAGTDNDGTANAIWADGGNVVINGGTYSVGGDTSAAEQNHQNDLIYTKNGGTVTINGGTFLYTEGVWTLNENDSNRGTITVYGGTFEKFNPADNKSEGEHTSFLAEGYCAVEKDGYYTVQKHSEAEAVVENEKAATCTADGSYDTVVYCSFCNAELSRETTVVKSLGHSYDAVVTEPTCTEGGYTTYTCSVCGDSYTDNEVAATGHQNTEVRGRVEPTLNTTGYTGYTVCLDCGVTIDRGSEIPVLTGAVAQVNGIKFFTLAEAVAAAEAGNTVVLLVDTTEDIVLDKAVTLNLGGNTLNGQILVKAAVTVQNGKIYAANKDAIIIGVKDNVKDETVSFTGGALTVTSETDCAVLIYDGFAKFQSDTLISNSTGYAAIQGSGNQFGDIELGGCTVTSANEVAIYWPHVGTLTTSGGTITGSTGLYIKQGTANLGGTKITGNGAKAAYTPNGNGGDSTGDAITVDTGATDPVVNLYGVQLNSANSQLVGIYGGTVNLNGASLTATRDAFHIEEGTLNLNSGSVTAGECAVYIRGGDVYVSGCMLKSTSTEYAAVQGNGNCGGNLTVTGGWIVNDNEVGIYWPGSGNLTVKGGTIEGTTGIYAKQGNVTISDGAAILGKGAKADFNHNGNGGDSTGDALVLESCDYGTLTASITGGTFQSTNGAAVAAYAQDGYTALTGFITGGTYSSDVNDYCADGYLAEQQEDNYVVREGNYVAQVGTAKFESFEDALAAAKAGDVKVVTLLSKDGIEITADTTYDLTGITVESEGDVFVVTGGTLTLNGDGVVKGGTSGAGSWTAVWADGGNVVINGGTYSVCGDSNVAESDPTHQNDVIYAKNGGSVVINGGTFLNDGTVWTLNKHDKTENTILVKGGTFQNWNPADNKSEGEHTSFVAEGYCSALNAEGYYTVQLHAEAEAVVENEKAATCTADGSYDTVVYCSFCNAELSRETTTVPATGHTPAEAVIIDGFKVVNCSVCGTELSREAVETGKVVMHQMQAYLEAEILMEYTLAIPEELVNAGAYVVLTKDGRWGEVTKEYKGDDLAACLKGDVYAVTIGVASGEMTRGITVQVFDGEGNALTLYNKNDVALGTSATRTVVDFAKSVLNNSNSTAERKALAVALVTYGGYAQKNFNVSADEPAYALLDELSIAQLDLSAVTAETVDSYRNAQTNTNMGVKASQTEAVLDSYISYRVYLTVEGDISNYTFSVVTPTGKQDLECSYDSARGYYVEIPDIASGYIDYNYKLIVTNAEGETNEITTSVLAYVRSVLRNTSNSQEKINLAKALYLYNQAADAYFGK